MVCGYCGYSIIAETGTARNGTLLHYYKCRGRKQKNGCQKEVVPKDTLEKLIIEAITEHLNQPEQMKRMIEGIMRAQMQDSGNDTAITQLQYEKKQAETTIQNIMAAVEKGVVTATTTKRLLEMEQILKSVFVFENSLCYF